MKEYNRVNLDTAAPSEPDARILVIYTGGTFGMGTLGDGSFTPFNFEDIINAVPSLMSFNFVIEVLSFNTPVDSSNIRPYHWLELAEIIEESYQDFDGFVVLHGTDTMAYTASALSFILQGLQKPVIFTGAQLPIMIPRSDAAENFITSLEIASHKVDGKPAVPEVCIYFNYDLIRGNRAKKVESVQFDAFESENYPLLAKSGISIEYNHAYIRKYDKSVQLDVKRKWSNEVIFLKLFPGLNEEIITHMVKSANLRGIVLETFGNGNAPMDSWFVNLLKELIKKGVIVFNVSQCLGGRVIQGRYETSKKLEEIGVVSGGDITSEAAITKMMYLLGNYSENNTIRNILTTSLCGEITV